jgi:hypothetical protein
VGSVVPRRASAVLAVNLCSELANPLRRTLPPTALVAQTERRAWDGAKEAVAQALGSVEPTAISVVLAVNLASASVMIVPRTSRPTANVARTARLVKDMLEANVAPALGSVGKTVITVVLVVRRLSGLVTAVLEAFLLTANVAKMARPARDMPGANAAPALATAAKKVLSAMPDARPPSEFATVAPEVPRQKVHVARTARPARAILEANVAPARATAEKRVASVAQAANPPLASAILAPGASQPMESVVVRMARLVRATQRANAAVETAFAGLHLTSAPSAARALLANAIPALALSRPMESAAARTDESVKAMLMENAVRLRDFAAPRLLSVVLVARTHSVFATAAQAPFQRISNAP